MKRLNRNPKKRKKPTEYEPPDPAADESAAPAPPVPGAEVAAIAELPQEVVDFSKINPAPYNPRKDLTPDDAEWKAIERGMQKFGFAHGMVWNRRTGNLVGGHQRLKILKHRGWTKATMSVCDMTLDDEKLFNLELNKAAGAWEQESLAALLEDIRHLPDANVSGFSDDDFTKICDEGAKLIEQLVPVEEQEDDDDDGSEDGSRGEGAGGGEKKIPTIFDVTAVCKTEKEQKRAYNLLTKAGFSVRANTLYE